MLSLNTFVHVCVLISLLISLCGCNADQDEKKNTSPDKASLETNHFLEPYRSTPMGDPYPEVHVGNDIEISWVTSYNDALLKMSCRYRDGPGHTVMERLMSSKETSANISTKDLDKSLCWFMLRDIERSSVNFESEFISVSSAGEGPQGTWSSYPPSMTPPTEPMPGAPDAAQPEEEADLNHSSQLHWVQQTISLLSWIGIVLSVWMVAYNLYIVKTGQLNFREAR